MQYDTEKNDFKICDYLKVAHERRGGVLRTLKSTDDKDFPPFEPPLPVFFYSLAQGDNYLIDI